MVVYTYKKYRSEFLQMHSGVMQMQIHHERKEELWKQVL